MLHEAKKVSTKSGPVQSAPTGSQCQIERRRHLKGCLDMRTAALLVCIISMLFVPLPGSSQGASPIEEQLLIVPGERLGDRLNLRVGIRDLDRLLGPHELQPTIHRNARLWRQPRVFAFVCADAIGTLGFYEPRPEQDPLDRVRLRTKEGVGIRSTMKMAITAYVTPAGEYSRVAFSSTDGEVPVIATWWVDGLGAGLFAEFRRAAPRQAWALAVFRRGGDRCF